MSYRQQGMKQDSRRVAMVQALGWTALWLAMFMMGVRWFGYLTIETAWVWAVAFMVKFELEYRKARRRQVRRER